MYIELTPNLPYFMLNLCQMNSIKNASLYHYVNSLQGLISVHCFIQPMYSFNNPIGFQLPIQTRSEAFCLNYKIVSIIRVPEERLLLYTIINAPY